MFELTYNETSLGIYIIKLYSIFLILTILFFLFIITIAYSDYIVIAAPIEKTNITFQNIDFYSTVNSRSFVHCYVTHVQAMGINPEYFGMDPTYEVPDSILTTPSSSLPFTIIGIGKWIL